MVGLRWLLEHGFEPKSLTVVGDSAGGGLVVATLLSARDEGVHVVGLSILSGSHGVLVLDVLKRLRDEGLGELPVIVGGIIPADDAQKLEEAGVKRVYTPKDFDLSRILAELVELVAEPHVGH